MRETNTISDTQTKTAYQKVLISKKQKTMNSIGFPVIGLNGKRVMVKFTALKNKTVNSKTGDMVQSWMLPMDWVDAKRIDDDEAVCGDCPHSFRAADTCYLHKGMAFMGLLSTTKSWPQAFIDQHEFDQFVHLFSDRLVRFGSFGEPVLMGEDVVSAICSVAKGWTGYTHQWDKPQYQWAKKYFMASADTEEKAQQAQAMGWRTFRVRQKDDSIVKGEVNCPASKESNKKTTCSNCRLCMGTSSKAKSVTIIKH